MTDWNPAQYLTFAQERARPAIDLIARIGLAAPKAIVDLGCGPGNSTALLRKAFPRARITGVDASPAMIERARESGVAAVFELSDATGWRPSPDVDLVFSNALLQWVPKHQDVMQQVFMSLQADAVLAVQMPDNLSEPSHSMMAETARLGPWAERLAAAVQARSPLKTAASYYKLLKPGAKSVDIWRTTYHHQLEGLQGIVDMLSSTGLKPYLDPLDESERRLFLARYREAIAPHYPMVGDGKVLLPFPRLFIVASRASN